jgi:hypothetical protein
MVSPIGQSVGQQRAVRLTTKAQASFQLAWEG